MKQWSSSHESAHEQFPFLYTAHGLTIASTLACPQLLPGNGVPDVTIRYGRVPLGLDNAHVRNMAYAINPTQVLLCPLPIARYLVSDGKEIIIEPGPDGCTEDIHAFLFGPVLAALLYQRGTLVLHGSAIATTRGAVIFAGPSGHGKSTLAAAFQKRGYQVLADDVCAISFDASGAPQLYPAFPFVKLCADAVQQLDHDIAALQKTQTQQEKYTLPLTQGVPTRPILVYAVYELHTSNTQTFSLITVRGQEKLQLLLRNTYRKYWLRGMGKKAVNFQQCMATAQLAKVSCVARPQQPFLLNELVDLLEKDLV